MLIIPWYYPGPFFAGVDWESIANVALTTGLVYFARTEIELAKRARKARERATGIRVSAEAYNAVPVLTEVIAAFPRRGEPEEDRAQMQWASKVESLTVAYSMNNLLVLSADASDEIFVAIDDAYKKFRKAQEEATHCVVAYQRAGRDLSEVEAFARASLALLKACTENLTKVTDPELLHQTFRPSPAGPSR